MTFTGNATNLYCAGCAPGDFPHPHICGRTLGLTTGFCYLCNQPWTGSHICAGPLRFPDTAATIEATTGVSACDHCWCLKQKAGWYDVPSLEPVYPGSKPATNRRHLKPHQACCNCGTRKVKD